MKLNKLVSGTVAIGLAAIMWGLDGVVLTPRLHNLNVSFVVFILHLLPFIIMNAFLYKEYKKLKEFSAKDYALLVLIALTGGVIGTLAIVKALFLVNFQELSVVVLLQKLQPVFAITLAVFLLKEKLSRTFLIWATLALIAGYTLSFGLSLPNMQTGSNAVKSAIYAIVAAFCFGSSTVFSKLVLKRYSSKTIGFYRYGFTALILFVVVLLTGVISEFTNVTSFNWLIFVIIGLTTGSGATFLYYYGLNNVKATVSVIIELLFPISAILFDYFINGSKLSIVQWLSAIVMIFAIYQLNNAKNN